MATRCKACLVRAEYAMETEYGWDIYRGLCYKCRDAIPEYIPEVQYRKYILLHWKLNNGYKI